MSSIMTKVFGSLNRVRFYNWNCYSLEKILRRSYSSKENPSILQLEKDEISKESSSSTADAKDMAPDKHSTALLLIDVINHLDFPGNEELIKILKPVGKSIVQIRKAARNANIPTIFVNDNFHKWKSDFHHVVENVLEENKPGKILAELLPPDESDYFVLKPKHSGFYCTPLEILLDHLQAKTLILTGFAGNICVLFTANDAYMRNYKLVVPQDCIASNTPRENEACLEQIDKLLRADIRPSKDIIKDIEQGIFNQKHTFQHSTERTKNKA